MLLYESLRRLTSEQWKYYDHMGDCEKDQALDNLNRSNAEIFIRNYFMHGKKSGAFDIDFFETYLVNGKHEHTVILYLLGCLLSDIISEDLRNHLFFHIPHRQEWYDFRYTWFLTCLYHDTAAVIEKSEWKRECSTNLDFYLGKYDVQYNVFNHSWENPQIRPYTYPEELVKNYFKYRVEYCHSIDHGIIAGYLFYDRLVKNYNDAWCKYSLKGLDGKYEYFENENLTWRKEHLSHFAIIADAIIAHNIWHSENTDESKNLYCQYGLDTLIYNPDNRITKTKNPLVFFLGLLDSVEPFKRFNTSNCLTEIEIDTINNKSIKFNDLKSTNWLKGIYDVSDWLGVNVENISPNEVIITI